MTIAEARQAGAKLLTPHSDAPDIDAQWLLLKTLNLDSPSYLISHAGDELPLANQQAFEVLVRERATGKPLAYVLGWAEFYGRRFIVNEHILVPRPATEDLVTEALPWLKTLSENLGRPMAVADIGTGSGCIAITLALESSAIKTIYATDISREALAVAQENARLYGVGDKIEFLEGDMLAPLNGKAVDAILSNPPYVPSAELGHLSAKETRGLAFEPRGALDGGLDGLKYVRQIEESGIPALVETVGGIVQSFHTKTAS